jgi:hypothetical protein
VTDGARTRDLRSHKWVVGAQGAAQAGLLRVRECPDEGRSQYGCIVECEEAKPDPSLPPAGGPAQMGTTPGVALRALIGRDGEAKIGVAL